MKIIRKVAEPFKHVEIRELDADGVTINNYVIAPGDNFSAEPQEIQDACAALHTPEVITEYAAHVANQE